MSLGIDLAERGYVPDVIVRLFMRRLLKKRLAQDRIRSTENGKSELIDEMCESPIAINTVTRISNITRLQQGFFS